MAYKFYTSVSKLETYHNCRRLYLYKYVQKRPEPPSTALEIGNTAHLALELFHKHQQDSDENLSKLMSESFRSAVRQSKGLTTPDKQRIKRMLLWYLKTAPKPNPQDIVSVEQLFKLPIGNDVVVVGKADRVDSRNNELVVVDYKTNKKALTKKEILNSPQIPTYVNWARKKFRIPAKGEYVFLEPGKVISVSVSEDQIKQTVAKFWEMAAEVRKAMRTNEDWFFRNLKFKWCGYCSYREHCFKDQNSRYTK